MPGLDNSNKLPRILDTTQCKGGKKTPGTRTPRYARSHASPRSASTCKRAGWPRLPPWSTSCGIHVGGQPGTRRTAGLSSLALIQGNAFADAEPMLRECLTIREKAAPDDWRTFNTKSMLGGALLGQAKQLQATDAAAATAKFTEAEPLLVQGYEGMQQREATIPPEGSPA